MLRRKGRVDSASWTEALQLVDVMRGKLFLGRHGVTEKRRLLSFLRID